MSKYLFALLILFQVTAFGETFEYEIKSYPESGNCHQVAASLAAQVSEHLAEPAKGRCVSIEKTGFTILINYQAEEELPIHSTYSDTGLVYDFAAYKTQEECNEALPEWTSNFVRNTQLQPLVAYCFNEHPDFASDLNWAVRIDGIGVPAKRPVTSGIFLHGQPVNYPVETFADTIKEKLGGTGIEFAHARFRYKFSQYQLDLIYYTDGPYISSGELADFRRVENCEAELSEAKTLLSKTKTNPDFLFCTKNFLQGSSLMGLYTLGSPKTWLAAERMESYEDCHDQKQELVQTYQQTLGYSDVVGGICSKVGSEYKLVLVPSGN